MILLLGGWQVSGITTIQHGVPLVVTDGTSNNGGLNSGFNNRANYNPSCGSHAGIVNKPNGLSSTQGLQWFDTTCFSDHTANYTYGTSVPGNVWGPGIVNFDLSLSKAVKFRENLELRFERTLSMLSTRRISAIRAPPAAPRRARASA